MLEPRDLVVLNTTKVRAARLRGSKKGTGGAVEVLLLSEETDGAWTALIRPSRRVHAGQELQFGDMEATVEADPVEGRTTLRFEADDVEGAVARLGEVPLPPYITAPLADPSDYQTVFADRIGSAAAPTAGLHVSTGVLARLRERGIRVTGVDLHVGLDTFRPIAVDAIEDHRMHTETFDIPPDTAEAYVSTREAGGRIVAIGTTVVRALESSASRGGLTTGPGRTDLFIAPGHRFQAVDAIVTNFHVPRSTLVVMIAAFMGNRWREAYETALARGYRFLSFGDAMYVERA